MDNREYTLAELMARPDVMSGMSHADLYQLREKHKSAMAQSILGPYEHQAYARETVAENPLNSIGMALAVPAYTALKAAGLHSARSPASFDEIGHGYKGIAQGLGDYLSKLLRP